MSKKELTVKKEQNQSNKDLELAKVIVDAIQDLKGLDVVLMNLRKIPEASAAYFVVCHGSSSTHLSGIADRVEKNVLEKCKERPNHVEGRKGGNWVLLDYFTVVVHVFDKTKREFYDLEGLWSDAKIQRFENP